MVLLFAIFFTVFASYPQPPQNSPVSPLCAVFQQSHTQSIDLTPLLEGLGIYRSEIANTTLDRLPGISLSASDMRSILGASKAATFIDQAQSFAFGFIPRFPVRSFAVHRGGQLFAIKANEENYNNKPETYPVLNGLLLVSLDANGEIQSRTLQAPKPQLLGWPNSLENPQFLADSNILRVSVHTAGEIQPM